MVNNFGDAWARKLEGHQPKPRPPQAQGLQEGTIVDVYETTATFTLSTTPLLTYGPAPFGQVATSPRTGDRCLISFVGTGIDRPWIISFTSPG